MAIERSLSGRTALGVVVFIVLSSPCGFKEQRAFGAPADVVMRQEAESSWTVSSPSSKHDALAYLVRVRRTSSPGAEARTTVSLGRYWCDYAGRNGLDCRPALEISKEIPNKNFRFNNTLDEASVKFRVFRKTQKVTWINAEEPRRSGAASYCGGNSLGDNYEGVYRPAQSRATLLNRRLRFSDVSRWDFVSLTTTIGVETC